MAAARNRKDVGRPQMFIFGEIEGAVPNWPLVRLYCSWKLVYDPVKFAVIQGETEGETFTSHVGPQGLCVWNHPVSVHMALKALQGWPRLELVVRGSDAHGRHRLAGYGSWALPSTAGSVEVQCRCWRPTGNRFLSRLRSYLLGIVPELQQSALLSDPATSRPGFRTEDSVDVLLRINIIHQNFALHGLET
mmetsp:Transcript_18746/g.35180  ORF Transcript_18746/g.35180 Transcript_18746/m.35180 type:complete len:191 (-) Transcript_18746:54-626(-)